MNHPWKMNSIFITGTAGSGKSLLTARLLQSYVDRKSFPISINLDPGVVNLPYEPDVDVRDYIDINTLMETYDLGPNGSLVMASDMIAMRLDEIQDEVNNLNPDYILIDTPGQIELFAFRASGPYFVSNFQSDNKVTLFIYDGTLVSSPINFVSIGLLSSSVRLRLKIAQVNILTKRDLIVDKLKDILEWSCSSISLESSLDNEKDSEYSLLSKDLVRSMNICGITQNLIAVSSMTMNGMVNLSAALARILSQGEEVKD
jgi:GTPase SAR1 family protein